MLDCRVSIFLGESVQFLSTVPKEPMKKTKLKDYRRQVENYFHMEFSDVPLEQVLLRLPEKYTVKVAKLVRLFHSLKKPPSDAAGYAMRFLRPPFRCLIVGQEE